MIKKKLLVLASGWHYSSHFYEHMITQKGPENWEIDYFCISHRHPENSNVINEKAAVREYLGTSEDNLLLYLDSILYEDIISEREILELGWKFIEMPNSLGDMEIFNQWSEKYNYKEYSIFLISHDDNLILTDQIFVDILSKNISLYKPIISSRYGPSKHQFKTEIVENKLDWLFLDNGYTENIPKAFTPRGSFSFYARDLIDLLPDNKFNMYESGGLGIVNRVGKTNSPGHNEIAAWNTHAGTFRDFLYEKELVEKTRWLSNTKRVSKYVLEGERGFLHYNNTSEDHYYKAVKDLFDVH